MDVAEAIGIAAVVAFVGLVLFVGLTHWQGSVLDREAARDWRTLLVVAGLFFALGIFAWWSLVHSG